jgi:hypothetical protein
MTLQTVKRRLAALEAAPRDDTALSIPATYRDASGAVVHHEPVQPVTTGGPVDYRRGIWER